MTTHPNTSETAAGDVDHSGTHAATPPPMSRRRFVQSAAVAAGFGLLPCGGLALQYTARPSSEMWAIIYGSRYGSARDAAVWISEGMGGIAHVLDAKEKPDPNAFDHWIVGGGVYFHGFDQALVDWLAAHRRVIDTRIRAIFAVAGSGGTQRADRYVARLAESCGGSPRWKVSFPGRITRRLLSPEDDKALQGFYRSRGLAYEDYDRLTRRMAFDFGDLIRRESAAASAPPPAPGLQ